MAAPQLQEELMDAILLLLPPDNPSCLLRASLIGKPWSRAATRPDFLRRLHAHHGKPPLLGFLHNSSDPSFVPTTASAFSLPSPDRESWRALDFRRGRGEGRPGPPCVGANHGPPAAPAGARGAQDRLLQRGRALRGGRVRPPRLPWGPLPRGPRLLRRRGGGVAHFSLRVLVGGYTWGEPTTLSGTSLDFNQPGVLVGDSLLYFISDSRFTIEYDFAKHGLDLFDTPGDAVQEDLYIRGRFILMLSENGGLGAAVSFESRLHLWARETNDGSDERWVQTKVMDLANLIPVGPIESAAASPKVMGYANGTNTIFVSTIAGLFTIDLQSEQARKVSDNRDFYPLIPIASFYIPSWTLQTPQGEHLDLLVPSDGEGGGQEEKTLEAQVLFDRGSKAIKEGDFIHTVDCLGHALKIRVALFGQLAPGCAATYWKYGCALLLKVREMAVPLGNVPKKAQNEESLRSTTSKSDTRNSKAPGSNHENTPSLDEGYSGNGQNPNCKDQEHETGDAKIAGDDADSELNLAWEMLNLARRIVEQKPDDNTMEKAKILFAMAEVSMERGDLDNSLGYYSEALAILEHLVEPDHRRILGINFRICLVLVSASKIGDAIQYCGKAVSLCKSRLLNLKNAVKASLADESANHAFAAEGGSENSTLEDEMNFFAGLLAEFEKKLQELEVAKSTPSSAANETLKRVSPRSPLSGVLSTLCQELYL